MILSLNSSSIRNSDSRFFLVTGATGAIRNAIARQLAATPTSEGVLVCRDKNKAQQAMREIVGSTGNAAMRSEPADLSSYDDVRQLADC
jgi:retinol dehydrogenase 12